MSKFASFLTLILLAMSTTLISSCESQAVKNLKKQVEITNAQCPLNGGSGGDLISVKYNDRNNQVSFYWSINEETASIDFLKTSEEDVRNQMKLMFQDNSARQMLKDLVKADASLNIVYKSPSTGKTAQFVLSVDDLKDIQNAPLMTVEERLKMIVTNQIKLENKKCPYKVDEGMRMTKVDLVNNNMVYYCELDEDLYDINQFQYAESDIIQGIKDMFKESLKTDIVSQRQFKMMYEIGMGVQYRYYGKNSQKAFDVIITPQELYNLLPKRLR